MIKPANYDVTIVEYMDYQCPHCRATHKPLKQLLAKDKRIRVIFRDWPIFGDASSAAALMAIASKYQGKYVAMHDALMETPLPLSQAKIKSAAGKAGVDWDRAQKDIEINSKEIEDLFARNDEQAQLLGLEGTPGFIIGDVQSFGGMTLEQLEQSVAAARKAKSATAVPAAAADAELLSVRRDRAAPKVEVPAQLPTGSPSARNADDRGTSGTGEDHPSQRFALATLPVIAGLVSLCALLGTILWRVRRDRSPNRRP